MDNRIISLFDNLPHNLNMTTKVWGPALWFFLHSMAMTYPKHIHNYEQDQKTKYHMTEFIRNLGPVIPCTICKNSYSNFINELKFMEQLNSRKHLVKFFYDLHNKVNHKLGVPDCDIPSFYEVVTYYKKFIAGGCKATTDQEKAEKRKQGCKNTEIVDYKCSINILDKNDNKFETIKGKEKFGNSNSGNGNNGNGINLCLLLLLIIAIIVIGVLLFKK